jgi:hypothetical protein
MKSDKHTRSPVYENFLGGIHLHRGWIFTCLGVYFTLDAGETLMQFKVIPALLVFMGSYFPLALILALQDVSESTWSAGVCTEWRACQVPDFAHPWWSLSFVVVTGLCLILTFMILRKIRCKYPVKVIESKPIPSELISYSFPYIVSFMGVDYGSIGKIAGLAVFLFWLFLITFKSSQIIMNPILLIFGWNLYEAKVLINGHPRIAKILGRWKLPPGDYFCDEVQGNYITKGAQ